MYAAARADSSQCLTGWLFSHNEIDFVGHNDFAIVGRERSRKFYLSASLINKRREVADFVYQEHDTTFVSRFYCL